MLSESVGKPYREVVYNRLGARTCRRTPILLLAIVRVAQPLRRCGIYERGEG